MKRVKLVLAVTLILVLVGSMVGCGGTPADSGAVLKIGNTTEIDTLNPLTSYMQTTYEIFLTVYDPLVRYDENFDPTPSLATEWSLSDDELTWTFKLAEGVKWHDGEPFTSADVKYTYDTMIQEELGYLYSTYLEGIESIECLDDYTVVIKTEAPKANMLMNTTPILPEHILSEVDDFELWENPKMIGTGYFKLDSFAKGEYIKLVKNDDYFGEAPHIDTLMFVQYANADVMAQALDLGEIDMAVNLNSSQKEKLEAQENLEVISGSVPGFTQIAINCWADSKSMGNPLLLDKNIRQAIDYATDKQKILDMAYYGQGQIGTTLINPGDFFHYEPAAGEKREFNIEKATALLEGAGYKDTDGDGIREDAKGNKLSFKLIIIAGKNDELKAAQLIVASCKQAGIELKIETMDDGALYDTMLAGNYDMFIWGWGSDIDPTVILNILHTSQIGANNETFFSDARYDQLQTEQQQELDEDLRQQMVFEMQKIAYDEAPYIILLYDNNVQAIKSDKWTGYKQVPEGGPYIFNMTDYFYKNIALK